MEVKGVFGGELTMYSYVWDNETGGYILTTETGKYVANEIRPVFSEELELTGLKEKFVYDPLERRPLLWAQKNTYLINGEKVAQMNNTHYGNDLSIEYFFEGKINLRPINIALMIQKNAKIMDIVIADAKRRAKELYDADIKRCDTAYIAFSGGKDSVALLDICHQVLPHSIPVIFSDTDMELPDSYDVWNIIKTRYPERDYIRAIADTSALENWKTFAPPSRTIRWCCSVHKSTPAIIFLKKKLKKSSIKVIAFVGVRGDESFSRSFYEDSTDGVKNASQLNRMPILDWGAHELWLYIFANNLPINNAYRKGLPRVGCIMCPESSAKYAWYVDRAYPGLLQSYNDVIIETSAKSFKNKADKIDFIGSLNWQARKSGAVLNETLSNPIEETNGLTTVFKSPFFKKRLFNEWIKTIGTIVIDKDAGQHSLVIPKTLNKKILFIYEQTLYGGKAEFVFNDKLEQTSMIPLIRACLRKVAACVGCRCCEAECPTGSISFENGAVLVDERTCIKCQKCYSIDYSCWRFKSMYKAETEQSRMTSINVYNNFGIREKDQYLWISTLVEMGEEFFPWTSSHPLGKKMVDAASSWFKQALLVDNKTKKPLPLVSLFEKFGGDSKIGWEFIWIALANNAALVKWFVTSTDLNVSYSIDHLSNLLSEENPELKKGTIDGGLSALKDMLTKSPLGGENSVVSVEAKGRIISSVTRKTKDIESLTILYSLYLIANISNRSSFTVREMLTADSESSYISPIVAFGISAESFKKQCEGLKSRYPDFISTTFTHGNDGFEVFPSKHNLKDIIKLAMED